MSTRGWLLVLLTCCADPPPPPAPVQKVVKPEPPPPVEVKLPPPPPESVAAFPDEVEMPEDAATDERLLRLLLADPVKAEAALQQLTTPDGWRVSVIAQFALLRGEKSFELDPEPLLPLPAVDAGVVSGKGFAWLSEDGVPLVGPSKKGRLLTLPLNTRVEVRSLGGEWAELSVPVATLVVYGEQQHEPTKVISTPVLGRVKINQLSPVPQEAEALMREALTQSDDHAGRLLAVSWWQRAWRLERSERTRAGLLRAAWAARRASTVVRAALARNLAPATGLRFAWACTANDPSAASWLDVSNKRPASPPLGVCLSGLDARSHCANESAAALKRAAETKKWIEAAALVPRPWLRFTVDARDPRQVFVVTTPLEVADACSEFEEVTFEAGSGLVRRLALPLGTKSTVVWMPVTRHSGAEFSIPSAASESQAISWLRSRGHYRYTVGEGGELQPSLGVNALSYNVSEAITAASFSLPPERDCSCD